jgi:hypothetical protein
MVGVWWLQEIVSNGSTEIDGWRMSKQNVSREERRWARIQRPSVNRVRQRSIGHQRGKIQDYTERKWRRSTPMIRSLRATDSQSKITSLDSIRKNLTSRSTSTGTGSASRRGERRRRGRESRRWGRNRKGRRRMRNQMARDRFVKDNITGKMISTLEITNTPAHAILLITNKDSLKATRATLDAEFRSDRHKTLTPPYTKMGKIRLHTMKTLVRGDIRR